MKIRRGPSVSPAYTTGEINAGIHSSASGALARSNQNEQLIHLNLFRALQLHRRLALGCAVAGLLLAVAFVILQWPVYTAKSQIYVQPVQPKVMGNGNDQNNSVNAAAYDAYVQQQVQSASSPAVLLSALKKLGPGTWQHVGESDQAAADRLGRAVDATRIGTGYEVAITARASDPSLSAKIANAVAGSIAEKASSEGNAGDAQRIVVLREERDRIQSELKQDYAEQDDLNKQLGMASVGTAAPDMIDDQITKTRDELIKAQTDHDQAEAKFSAMRVGQGETSAALNAEADDLISADPGLSSMKTSLNQRRAVLITQMASLTPQNPGYKLAADELAKINGSLDAMMKDLRSSASARIQQKLRTDLERTARVEDQLNAQLRELARTAAGATPKLQRVNDLATDIVRLRNRFSIVDEQLHNLMVEDSAPGAVHVSVVAVAPLHPSVGKILKIALPLALGGLIFGLLAAIVANKLDPHVYIAADFEEALGFAPMAVLPDFDEVSEGVAAEHLMRLAAAMEHAGRDGDLQTCIFTGTSRSTGVTTVAQRVKDILAAMDKPAVLLDATGSPRPGSNEAETSAALLKQVASRAELDVDSLVLVDTAPLALSAETEYLARSVDGVIVVIQSGVTTRAQVLAAVNTLQRLEVSAVGFVLNRVALSKADPAFRHSLRDMEKHLHSQGASSSMWPVSWHGSIAEPARGEPARGELAHSEPVRPPQSAAEITVPPQPSPAPEIAVQSAVDRPPPSAVYGFAQVQAAVPNTSSARQNTAPASAQDKPWWLQPPSNARPAPTQTRAVVKPEADSQHRQPPQLPDWFWDRGTNVTGDFTHIASAESAAPAPEPISSPIPQPTPEQMPTVAELRMEQLRGLFANVGLEELRRKRRPLAQLQEESQDVSPVAQPMVARESVAQESVAQTTVAQSAPAPTVTPVQSGSQPPAAAQTQTVVAPPPETRVVAKPETLSSREVVSVKEPAGISGVAASRDEKGEIRILPAKRGQYGSR